jgi:hypothetical protein
VSKNAVLSLGSDSAYGMVLIAGGEGADPQPARVEIQNYDSDNYRIVSGAEAGTLLVSPQALMDEDGGFAGGIRSRGWAAWAPAATALSRRKAERLPRGHRRATQVGPHRREATDGSHHRNPRAQTLLPYGRHRGESPGRRRRAHHARGDGLGHGSVGIREVHADASGWLPGQPHGRQHKNRWRGHKRLRREAPRGHPEPEDRFRLPAVQSAVQDQHS